MPGDESRRLPPRALWDVFLQVLIKDKPVLKGSATQDDPDKSMGVEYAELETYVKTISIEH